MAEFARITRLVVPTFAVEATRKRLEALLLQLKQATATADHTIAEVKAALREIDDSRIPPPRVPTHAPRRKTRAVRPTRKKK